MSLLARFLKDYMEYYKISQIEFADMLDISVKHLNEILNAKTKISLELMIAIALVTDIDVNMITFLCEKEETKEYLNKKIGNEKEIKKYLNTFFINDIYKRKWLTLKCESDVVQNYMDLKNFLKIKDLENYTTFLNKQYSFKKNDPNINMKTFLFITHCNHLIEGLKVNDYISKNIPLLLEELKTIRCEKFNKEKLIKLLNKYGIIIVIEEPLKGTKLRGCARVRVTTPVIYMTTLYKTLPSFYYTLYHEICHIKRDYNMLKNKTYEIDEDKEDECNIFALNQMIDNKLWKELKLKPNNYKEILKDNNIPVSFYYSRLAYENIISYKSKEYQDNIGKLELK